MFSAPEQSVGTSYFPLKNSSPDRNAEQAVMQTMQRFFKENYRKNLSVKFIHINSVTYLRLVEPKLYIMVILLIMALKRALLIRDVI